MLSFVSTLPFSSMCSKIANIFFLYTDKPINEFDKKDLSSKISDTRLKKFVHKLSCLEQQLRTMEAKIYLCSEDVRQLNSGKAVG